MISSDEKACRLNERLAPRLAGRLDGAGVEDAEDELEPGLALSLLADAAAARASDLHLEPLGDGLAIRLRIDGGLREAAWLPITLGRQMAGQLRTLARLDPVAAFRPEDARLDVQVGDHRLDLRLATAPCLGGEKLAIRIFESGTTPVGLEALGMTEGQALLLRRWLGTRTGLFMAAGPSGSGKTTTAHALIGSRSNDEHSVITLEDPVEYRLEGAAQIEIDPDHELAYPGALRAALRLDPDYLLVGEIRDEESARTAVRAAVSGHAVLTTLHAATASSALVPLLSRNVAPHELAASLSVVVAQRLVRRLCESCRVSAAPEPDELRWLEAAGYQPPDEIWRPAGCDDCHLGYRGRIGIFEVWALEDEHRVVLAEGADEHAVRRLLRESGIPSLLEDAVEKANEGMTSIDELRRIPDLLQCAE